mgnify:CR=1 FL=1
MANVNQTTDDNIFGISYNRNRKMVKLTKDFCKRNDVNIGI